MFKQIFILCLLILSIRNHNSIFKLSDFNIRVLEDTTTTNYPINIHLDYTNISSLDEKTQDYIKSIIFN